MKDKKVVFMGTPDFSVPVLKSLIANTNVIAVVTQPDKEVGRKKILTSSPVKQVALENNIKVLQPIKLKNEYESIILLAPDIIITCAYGQILPKALIEFPKYKTVNVHASLLPKLRGGAPIHHALIEGYDKTGITIMYTDEGMDSGNIITQSELLITPNDNYDSLSDKLSIMGADLLIETLPQVFAGTIKSIPQKQEEVTYAYNIKREDEHIDFNQNTKEVNNHIRGLSSHPGAYALLDNKEIKIYNARIGDNLCGKNGEIVEIYKDGIGVSTNDGEIVITKLQIPGKKTMAARDYLNGINKDELLGKIFK